MMRIAIIYRNKGTLSLEDDLNRRRNRQKTTLIEDDLTSRQLNVTCFYFLLSHHPHLQAKLLIICEMCKICPYQLLLYTPGA